MRIERCVCHKVEFSTVKRWLAAHPDAQFPQIQQEFKCGTGCGLCAPYLRRMMRTGETVYHHIVTERDEPLPPE